MKTYLVPYFNYHLKIALKNAGNEPGKLRVAFKINSGNKSSFYKIIQIVRALWLAIKPFYMSVCKHGFRSSFISYFIKEM